MNFALNILIGVVLFGLGWYLANQAFQKKNRYKFWPVAFYFFITALSFYYATVDHWLFYIVGILNGAGFVICYHRWANRPRYVSAAPPDTFGPED